MRILFPILAVVALIGGCASPYADIPKGIEAIPVSSAAANEAAPLTNYRIGPLDELRVTVFREPELSADALVVDGAGMVSMPLIGSVVAHGRTVTEMGAEIQARLNERYLRNAQVSVSVIKATNYVVTVGGEVKSPGTYQIPGRVTLIQAVAISGGITPSARRADIILFRKVDNVDYVARFDLRDIYAAKAPDPELKPGDTVIVGTSAAQNIYRDVLAVLPGLAGIFVAISQTN